MLANRSRIILALYCLVLALLPFSRLAELPILFLCLFGIYGIITRWQNLKTNPQFKILSIVFASYFCMVLFSATDSYWQYKTLIVALSSIRFYLASIALLLYLDKKDFPLMFKLVAILMLFWAVDALFQYFVGYDLIGRASHPDRINGIFGENHIKLGPVLALLLPIVMIAMRKQHSLLRWASTLVIIIIIILSGTRSAWIMMLFTLFAYWFHHVKYRRLQLMLKALSVAVILIATLWLTSTEFQKRINRSLALFDGSQSAIDFALADRIPIWITSLNMIQQHPINGIGAHSFRKAYPEFASDDDVWQQKDDVGMHAHHWILEVLAETGIIGMLIFLFASYKLIFFVKNNYHKHYSWAFMVATFSAFLPLTSTYSIFASFWSICIWFCGIGLIVVSKND